MSRTVTEESGSFIAKSIKLFSQGEIYKATLYGVLSVASILFPEVAMAVAVVGTAVGTAITSSNAIINVRESTDSQGGAVLDEVNEFEDYHNLNLEEEDNWDAL